MILSSEFDNSKSTPFNSFKNRVEKLKNNKKRIKKELKKSF